MSENTKLDADQLRLVMTRAANRITKVAEALEANRGGVDQAASVLHGIAADLFDPPKQDNSDD